VCRWSSIDNPNVSIVCTLKNFDGLVYAYIEWQILDEFGNFQENGRYIYIQDLWVNSGYDGREAIRRLSELINEDKRSNNALFVYWVRHKYNERKSKVYFKSKFIKGVFNGI